MQYGPANFHFKSLAYHPKFQGEKSNINPTKKCLDVSSTNTLSDAVALTKSPGILVEAATRQGESSIQAMHTTSARQPETQDGKDIAGRIPAFGHIYKFQTATDDSRQINGSVISRSSPGRKNHYVRNVSSGSSIQINGDICNDVAGFWSMLSGSASDSWE